MNIRPLSASEIGKRNQSRFSVLVEQEVTSTNGVVKQMAAQGIPSGLVLFAVTQTEGRGRGKRSFYSPADSGLYLSVYLEGLYEPSKLTPCAAVAVSRALEKFCDEKLGIKWVNDIYRNGRKICGILAEGLHFQNHHAAILGIGVNVLAPNDGFPDDIKDRAGWLLDVSPSEDILNEVAAAILMQLDDVLFSRDEASIAEEYRRRSVLLGKRVTVYQNEEVYTADVLGIDDDYALMVSHDGNTKKICFGDVSLSPQ